MKESWKCPAGTLHPIRSLTERSRHRSEAGVIVYLACDHGFTAVDVIRWREISPRFDTANTIDERQSVA